MSDPAEKKHNNHNLLAVVASILAAAIGVQSNKNREKDFATNSIWPYIVGGLIFTIAFIVVLVIAVKVMIANV